MSDRPTAERELVLSMWHAGPGERRAAVAAVSLSVVIFLVAVPFARVQLPRLDAFIPCYESALVINDLITAALLFGQFAITRSRTLQILASGYLFTALMAAIHALSFPGLFADRGVFGAGAQSTAWLYMFWHSGFPLAVMVSACLSGDGAGEFRTAARTAILSSVAAVVVLAAALTAVATAGEAWLPEIMRGNAYASAMIYIALPVWSLSLLALLALLLRRSHSVLDLWLMVVLCAWLCDIALSVMFNAGRFDLGFYAGRMYSLLAASVVLVVLLFEMVTLYARVARAMERERQERERRLNELHSELIHVSRLSELGQMVLALAHEVNQPLTAVANYLRAGRRLAQLGDTARLQTALGRADNEVTRASEILRRLRDFVRKKDSERRAEDIGVMLEETIALALVGAGPSAIDVDVRLHPETSAAFIDKVQIQQVLLNLMRNAIEAMAGRPHQALILATAPAAGDMVELTVADTGPGLPPTVRERLFQPFVTTKSNGMGVGLSICLSIIEAHGGRLWADEDSTNGTVFRFTVPRAEA